MPSWCTMETFEQHLFTRVGKRIVSTSEKNKAKQPNTLSTFSSISKLIIHENLWEVPMCQFIEFSFFLSQPSQVLACIGTHSAKRVKEGLQVELPSFLGTNAIGSVSALVWTSVTVFKTRIVLGVYQSIWLSMFLTWDHALLYKKYCV